MAILYHRKLIAFLQLLYVDAANRMGTEKVRKYDARYSIGMYIHGSTEIDKIWIICTKRHKKPAYPTDNDLSMIISNLPVEYVNIGTVRTENNREHKLLSLIKRI